tara:strand:- start:631 stop:1074 length:444 start_codon:yes stop_codon:yes gene_type:complete
MEFLLFLDGKEQEILELIYKANYKVEENTPLCLLGKDFFGFLKKKQRKVVICTKNAKEYGGYSFLKEDAFKTGLMIRRAIRHEAVHIAQQCNNGNLLNLKDIKMSPYKIKSLQASVKLTGQREEEYEAYALEDSPRMVIKALRTYCL